MVRISHLFVLLAVSAGLARPASFACAAEDSPKRIESDGAKTPSIDELLLFFPAKHPAGNWTPNDLRFDDVWITAEDQTRVHGWYCPCDNPRATILIAHGNAGNIATRAPWLRYLQSKAQVSTFLFDYRGYGRSEGVPTVEGALQDARAARTKLSELAGIKNSEMLRVLSASVREPFCPT